MPAIIGQDFLNKNLNNVPVRSAYFVGGPKKFF